MAMGRCESDCPFVMHKKRLPMNIPKKVKIGGLKYTVKISNNLANEGALGKISYSGLQIELQKAKLQNMHATLLHEILHGIYYHLGYTEHDEKKIDELANALYALIVDNPTIFKG